MASAPGLPAAPPAELFAQLTAALNPLISPAVPLISGTPGITEAMKVPNYSAVFVAIPLVTGGFALEFTGDYTTQMRLMIARSDNGAAAQCITRLGYSWLNGALASGGFFDTPTQQGTWLAGTFTGGQPFVRISSKNDGPVAQALSSEASRRCTRC